MFGRRYNLRSKKYLRDKRKQLLVESAIRFGIVILVVILLSLISHFNQFEIKEIKIIGNDVVNEKEIRDIAKLEISGKYFKIFPRNNSIIFPRKSIGARVAGKYRRIADIDVSFDSLHSIKIEVRERDPEGVFCEGIVSTETLGEESCYFLDSDGYVFSKAPRFSGSLFFKFYGGDIEGKVIGSKYLPKEKFKEISFFLKALPSLGIYPVLYEWGVDGDSSVVVVPKGDDKVDTTILFNNKDDLSRVYENLGLVLQDKTFSGEEVVSLEYIDFRFGNKVYFK